MTSLMMERSQAKSFGCEFTAIGIARTHHKTRVYKDFGAGYQLSAFSLQPQADRFSLMIEVTYSGLQRDKGHFPV